MAERSATKAQAREAQADELPQAQWEKLSELVPWDKNPRRNAQAVRPLANSIRRFGWGRPIVAQAGSKRIIVGHTARLAALELVKLWKSESDKKREQWHPEAVRTATRGEVVVRYKEMPDDEAEHLARADNKLGEISEWDEELLSEQLGGMNFADAVISGWSGKELAKIAERFAAGDAAEEEAGRALNDGLTYSVVVECGDETTQAALIERLEAEGLTCKPLVT